MRTLLLLLMMVLLLLAGDLNGQLSDQAQISVLTCRKGGELYSMYGHTAIRVKDPSVRMDQVYNYGVFSFEEPGFAVKFLRGKLRYFLAKSSWAGFRNSYLRQERSIHEQILNLDQTAINQLYAALEENLKPDNRAYQYDFFFDNCSTRVRDLLSEHIPGMKYPDEAAAPHSYRTLLDEYTYAWPLTDLGQDLIVGALSDADAGVQGQMYLPEYLHAVLGRASVGHLPLVKESRLLLDYEKMEQERSHKPINYPIWVFISILLVRLITVLLRKKTPWLDRIWYFLLGIGGLIIAFMWLGTDHDVTKSNLNLLWMNPLFLILAFKDFKILRTILLVFTILALLASISFQELHPCAYLMIGTTILTLIKSST